MRPPHRHVGVCVRACAARGDQKSHARRSSPAASSSQPRPPSLFLFLLQNPALLTEEERRLVSRAALTRAATALDPTSRLAPAAEDGKEQDQDDTDTRTVLALAAAAAACKQALDKPAGGPQGG